MYMHLAESDSQTQGIGSWELVSSSPNITEALLFGRYNVNVHKNTATICATLFKSKK